MNEQDKDLRGELPRGRIVDDSDFLPNDAIHSQRSENLALTDPDLVVVWQTGWELRPGYMTRTFKTQGVGIEEFGDAVYRVDIQGFDGTLTQLFLILEKFKKAIEGDVFHLMQQLNAVVPEPYTYFTLDMGNDNDIFDTVCALVTKES